MTTKARETMNEAERCVNTIRPLTRSLDLGKEGLAVQATQSHLARLLRRVVKRPDGYDTPCWDPGYARNRDGYCVIKLRPNPVGQLAHRFTYEQMVGPIPAGLVLDHLCKNRYCCNPAHVEPVTQRENVLRGEGWAPALKAQTHCKHGHEFTPENTRTTARGRECRACDATRARRRYHRNKEAAQ